MHPLAQAVTTGDVRSVARVCRMVDDATDGHVAILKDLFPHTGRAWIVGVTGSPGAGKSTLVDQLIASFRSEGKRVAVIAIDPTSPFSGGAILGDRIRMQRHAGDVEVFIRSVATRGALGGISRSTRDMARVLDAWGAGVVIVETVGVGQDEIEIARMAHTTVVVVAPGMGDDVQAAKAGIFECADVLAVNKADRDGADATVRDLELMIALGGQTVLPGAHSQGHAGAALDVAIAKVEHGAGRWVAKIQKCVAVRGEGTNELLAVMRAHRDWLESTEGGKERRRQRARSDMEQTLRDALTAEALALLGTEIAAAAAAVEARALDPYTASERLVAAFRREAAFRPEQAK